MRVLAVAGLIAIFGGLSQSAYAVETAQVKIKITGHESPDDDHAFAAEIERLSTARRSGQEVGYREIIVEPSSELAWNSPSSLLDRIDWRQTYATNYPNGDMYFLIGELEDANSSTEFQKYYSVAKWLARQGFRAILNPVAYMPDVREAVQNPNTSGLIWSSHGNRHGQIFDTNQVALPKDIFVRDAGPRLKHFVFSNCYGEATAQYYGFPASTRRHYWEGLTNTSALFKYLFSDEWNSDLEKDLGIRLRKKPTSDL